MNTPKSFLLFCLCCVAALASGCMSPYLRLHDSAKGLENAPTLLASAKYGDAQTQEAEASKRGLLKAAVKVVSNLNLDEVGEHLVRQTVETGKALGFDVTSNKDRAQRLDFITGGAVDALAGVAQVVGGVWIYPEGSHLRFIDDQTWLTEGTRKDIAKALDETAPGEFFVFVTARHATDREWLVFERAEVVVSFIVLSDEGRLVLEGRGIGYGDKVFWSENASPSGLRIAIDRAFKEMLAQPKKRLK